MSPVMSDCLGRFLKAVRILQGQRQADVAEALGVSPAIVSLTENGHRDPTSEELQRHLAILIGTDRPDGGER